MSTSAGTGTYLDKIVADVRARRGGSTPVRTDLLAPVPAGRSLHASIQERVAVGLLGIVAEVKRRSPSVGAIRTDVVPREQGAAYAAGGAAGISVLTEPDHFGGSLADLVAVRDAVQVPVLRKDFIVDVGQLEEARAAGADAVLLIAAIHELGALAELVGHAEGLGLEVLLEVHDEGDLERALGTNARLIGINNRDLRSFAVDLATTERLAPLVPPGRTIVAESGVRTCADAARLRDAGVHALLVGEALMRASDPAALIGALAAAGGGAR